MIQKRVMALLVLCSIAAIFQSCSSVNDFELVERSDTFKPAERIKKIIVLQPDYYMATDTDEDFSLYKSEKTEAYEKKLVKSCETARESLKISVVIPGVDDAMDPDYFNDVEKLCKEMTLSGYIYNLQSMDIKVNYPNTELLTTNLILSPDLESLAKKYNTQYFYHSTFIENKGKLYFLSVLADMAQGKIVYRELMRVKARPRQSVLDLMVFNNFNNIINQK